MQILGFPTIFFILDVLALQFREPGRSIPILWYTSIPGIHLGTGEITIVLVCEPSGPTVSQTEWIPLTTNSHRALSNQGPG